jgi:Cdc6-like AAA superfamily ATPase
MSQAILSERPYINSNLFSGHYLDERVQERDEWDCDTAAGEAMEDLQALHDLEGSLVEGYGEDALIDNWIDEVLDTLGFGTQEEVTLPNGGGFVDELLFETPTSRRNAAEVYLDTEDTTDLFERGVGIVEAKQWDAAFNIQFSEQRPYRNASHQTKHYLENDTQYKALRQILQELTGEEVRTGYHTSELQRKIQEQVEVLETVLVLDELDFLLLNDGDDLLYFLSRLNADLGLITITANHKDLSCQVEERTFSTLQPQRIGFEPFTGEEIYEVLADRARKSLKPRSLRREALTYIASSTQNLKVGLTWLRVSAYHAEDAITETLVKDVKEEVSQTYTKHWLQKLTDHHRLLYQAIEELDTEQEVVQTGDVYSHYKNLCQAYNEDPLTDRRTSDYLKQIEQTGLIQSQYYYGGQKGKTREIEIVDFLTQ